MIHYYHRDAYEAELCDDFDQLIRHFPNIQFFQPSPEKAPWHVQAVLDMVDGMPITLNFWPHKQKAQRQPWYAVEGPTAARDIIMEALADQETLRRDSTAFDVIEDL